jgi:2-amino-4-hydroxy-6-hydroxymethyldihydropteridine diphosphokinase
MAEIAAFVALGSNLDDPAGHIEQAFAALGLLPGTRLASRSSLYLTQPVGHLDQPEFVNAVAGLITSLPPRPLLDALLGIEASHGRRRTFRNAPRTLDLDLLLYNGLVMNEPGLTLPHPRMLERAFVLLPLAEIAADTLIPGSGPVGMTLAGLDRHGITRLPNPVARAHC